MCEEVVEKRLELLNRAAKGFIILARHKLKEEGIDIQRFALEGSVKEEKKAIAAINRYRGDRRREEKSKLNRMYTGETD